MSFTGNVSHKIKISRLEFMTLFVGLYIKYDSKRAGHTDLFNSFMKLVLSAWLRPHLMCYGSDAEGMSLSDVSISAKSICIQNRIDRSADHV